jgi:hypothetical protein
VIATAVTRAPGPSLDAHDEAELTALLTRLDRAVAAQGQDTSFYSPTTAA